MRSVTDKGANVSKPCTERNQGMKCAACGAKIGTIKSMLGGKLTEWHKPKRKAATVGQGGWCIGSGNVLPTKENPHAL